MDEKYIIDIKGKKFVTFNGLLDLAHEKGLVSLKVQELSVDWDKKSAFCIAACKIGEVCVTCVGSGTQDNCGSMVAGHFVEMSQTRAFARCLRTILNVDMVAVDELKEKEEVKVKESGDFGMDVPVSNVCSGCNCEVSEKVKEFSIRTYKRVLCLPCQNIAKAEAEKK